MKHPLWTYPLRFLTMGMTAWETWAILVDREKYPTFSRLAADHPWFKYVLIVALIIHLWWPLDSDPPIDLAEIS